MINSYILSTNTELLQNMQAAVDAAVTVLPIVMSLQLPWAEWGKDKAASFLLALLSGQTTHHQRASLLQGVHRGQFKFNKL